MAWKYMSRPKALRADGKPTVLLSSLRTAEEAVIMASGPSLTDDDIRDVMAWRARGWPQRQVIAVSTTFRRALAADAVYAGDRQWFEVYGNELFKSFHGEVWSGTESVKRLFPRTNIVRRIGEHRLPGDRVSIGDGNNSGSQALCLAAQTGVMRIVLLGFDFKHAEDGATHSHKPHPAPLRNAYLPHTWVYALDDLAPDFVQRGISVVNASRDTAITHFPRMALSDALA